jgi:ATP-dependent RNA helicase DDX54/DBP10
MLEVSHNLVALKKVSMNGLKLYRKTRCLASKEAFKRAKDIFALAPIGSAAMGVHPVFIDRVDKADIEKASVLDSLRSYRPPETIFEFRKMGMKTGPAAELMKSRRQEMVAKIVKMKQTREEQLTKIRSTYQRSAQSTVDESEVADMLSRSQKRKRSSTKTDATELKDSFRDEEYFIPLTKGDVAADRGYAINTDVDFNRCASNAQMDLVGDDADMMRKQQRSMKWDSKKKRFIQPTVGQDNKKMIRTESGALMPASFKTDVYSKWMQKTKMKIPKSGDMESGSRDKDSRLAARGKRYKHKKVTEAKPLDPLSVNYEKKVRKLKGKPGQPAKSLSTPPNSKGRNELKAPHRIVKERKMKEQRRAKNARPSKKPRRK